MKKVTTPRTLTQAERLNAIAWKAKQCGMSYGVYQATLTLKDYDEIYAEFAGHLTAKEAEEQERLAAAAATNRLGKSVKLTKGKTE